MTTKSTRILDGVLISGQGEDLAWFESEKTALETFEDNTDCDIPGQAIVIKNKAELITFSLSSTDEQVALLGLRRIRLPGQ